MKVWTTLILVAVILVPPTPSRAVDLVNEDNVSYQVLLSDEDKRRKVKLRPGEVLADVCRQCVVQIEGVGIIEAQPDDRIIIRQGGIEIKSRVR